MPESMPECLSDFIQELESEDLIEVETYFRQRAHLGDDGFSELFAEIDSAMGN